MGKWIIEGLWESGLLKKGLWESGLVYASNILLEGIYVC